MKIDIKEVIGICCITKEDGKLIYDMIHRDLLNNTNIILNFKGVKQFALPFFNIAIGLLLKDVSPEKLVSYLSFENLTPTANMIVKRVISNASQYDSNIDYQKIVDEILEDQEKYLKG